MKIVAVWEAPRESRTPLVRRLGLAAGRVHSPAVGYVTGDAKRPVMVSPWLKIALTLPLRNLLLEEGIGHCNRRFRTRHEEPHQEVVREQDRA